MGREMLKLDVPDMLHSCGFPQSIIGLHLARKLFKLHLDDMMSRHDNQPQVSRRHVDLVLPKLHQLPMGGFGRGLSVLVRMGKNNIPILTMENRVSHAVAKGQADRECAWAA